MNLWWWHFFIFGEFNHHSWRDELARWSLHVGYLGRPLWWLVAPEAAPLSDPTRRCGLVKFREDPSLAKTQYLPCGRYVLHSSERKFYLPRYILKIDGIVAGARKLRHGFSIFLETNVENIHEHPKRSGVESGYGLVDSTTRSTSIVSGELQRMISQFRSHCASCPTTTWWTSVPWATVASMPFTPSGLRGWVERVGDLGENELWSSKAVKNISLLDCLD